MEKLREIKTKGLYWLIFKEGKEIRTAVFGDSGMVIGYDCEVTTKIKYAEFESKQEMRNFIEYMSQLQEGESETYSPIFEIGLQSIKDDELWQNTQ